MFSFPCLLVWFFFFPQNRNEGVNHLSILDLFWASMILPVSVPKWDWILWCGHGAEVSKSVYINKGGGGGGQGTRRDFFVFSVYGRCCNDCFLKKWCWRPEKRVEVFLLHEPSPPKMPSKLLVVLKSGRLLCIAYEVHWSIGNCCCFLSSIFHLSPSGVSEGFYIHLDFFQTALRQVSGDWVLRR